VQRGSLQVVLHSGRKVWRAQWRENGRGRTRILGTYKEMTRAEARGELDRILAPLNAGAAARASGGGSLRRYIEDEYLVVKSRTWKASTRATTEQIIATHILDPIGDRTLATITRRELQALLDGLAAAGKSASIVEHVRWQLKAIFNMAVADGLIQVQPAAALVQPVVKAAPVKQVMTADQVKLAEFCLEIRERLLLRLAAVEGLRPGEVVGLRLADVDGGVVHIRRRIYRGVVDTPKSKRGVRTVPLTEGTQRALVEYMTWLTDKAAGAWLFPSETGKTPLDYANVFRRRIRPALAKAGLGWVSFQVMRRTCATELGQCEPDAKIRADLLGHGVDVHENEYRQTPLEVRASTMRRMGKRIQ